MGVLGVLGGSQGVLGGSQGVLGVLKGFLEFSGLLLGGSRARGFSRGVSGFISERTPLLMEGSQGGLRPPLTEGPRVLEWGPQGFLRVLEGVLRGSSGVLRGHWGFLGQNPRLGPSPRAVDRTSRGQAASDRARGLRELESRGAIVCHTGHECVT